MTKEEFIDHYLKGSKLPEDCKTEDGFLWPDKDGSKHKMLALPCNCGNEICHGWAMIPEQFADHHKRVYIQ